MEKKKKKKKNNEIQYENYILIPIGKRTFESDMDSATMLPDGRVIANKTKNKEKWTIGRWRYAKRV